MRIGYKLATEAFGPHEIVRQAVRAQEVGFDFVEMSDHFHPWLDVQGHSPFTWSLLGAIAAKTSRIELATGVTCPSMRYHPAIVAQAAATMALLSDGRFTLGVGAGERLNEHVVGTGFPSVRSRHARFREALEIIRLLWSGGYQSYEGRHLQLEDARVFDLPETLPKIIVACSGRRSAALAAELGDGVFATEPKAEILEHFHSKGGDGHAYAEVSIAWGEPGDAIEHAWTNNRWAVTGWKVMSELPNPVNFAAAASTVTRDDVAKQFAHGAGTQPYVAAVRPYLQAGFDHIVLMNAGADVDGFLDFFDEKLAPALRALG